MYFKEILTPRSLNVIFIFENLKVLTSGPRKWVRMLTKVNKKIHVGDQVKENVNSHSHKRHQNVRLNATVIQM